MIYDFYVNKDIKDRFKLFLGDNLIYSGYKEGNRTSFFDSYVESSFDKGSNFIFYDKNNEEVMKIERVFYKKTKKYLINTISGNFTLESNDSKSIIYNNEDKIDVSNLNNVELLDIGKIVVKKKALSLSEKFIIEINSTENDFLAMAVSVFIWDIFIKERLYNGL